MVKAKSRGVPHGISCAVVVIFTLVTGPVPNWRGLTEHMVPVGLSRHWGLPKGTFQGPGGGRGEACLMCEHVRQGTGVRCSCCREVQACWTLSAPRGSILITSQRHRSHPPCYLNVETEAVRPPWGVRPPWRPHRSRRLQSPPSWPCSPSGWNLTACFSCSGPRLLCPPHRCLLGMVRLVYTLDFLWLPKRQPALTIRQNSPLSAQDRHPPSS